MASRQGGKTVSRRDRSDDEDDRKATNIYWRGGIAWARFQVAGRELTLEQWGDALAAAYVSLGVTDYGLPTSNRATIGFA